VKHHRNGLFAHLACLLATLSCFNLPCTAAADEAGVSFWLPGQYGSFAAVPSEPGWSFESSYYHASADDSRGISFQRGGAIQAGMTSPSDLFMPYADLCIRIADIRCTGGIWNNNLIWKKRNLGI
jgi:hypothetical protein